MEGKKTTVNITKENVEKIESITKKDGITQTNFINHAIAGIPIISLGNRIDLANSFVALLDVIEYGMEDEMKKEVNYLCQLLSSLMEEVEKIRA